jgi:formate hydrogenlyase subunit 6/NADH:ubiquinone oxidoreductase subunit I
MITEACIGTKDQSCVEVCPVDCIYDAGDHFMINPEDQESYISKAARFHFLGVEPG